MTATQPYNIVLAGQFEVGKTTIFEHLRNNLLQQEGHMPPMADILSSTPGGKSFTTTVTSSRKWEKWKHKITCRDGAIVEVILWDTSGMEEHGIIAMTRSYFANSVAAILVYDRGEADTLHKLRDWVERAKWSESVDVVLSLWGNDKGYADTQVSEEDSTGFAALYGIQEDLIFTVNAESGTGVVESYQNVIEAVHCQHSPNYVYGRQSQLEHCNWTRFVGYSTSVDSGTFTHPASMQSSQWGHHAETRPSTTPCRIEPHTQQVERDGQNTVLLHEHDDEPNDDEPKRKCPC